MKKTSDVSWISPETGEVICTLNSCRKKFKNKCSEEVVMRESNGVPITYTKFFSSCTECGRAYAMTTDKQKTEQSKNKSLILV